MVRWIRKSTRDALLRIETAQGVFYEDDCRIIEGIVAPGGQSVSGSAVSDSVHFLQFADWRFPDGSFTGRSLTLLRRAPLETDCRSVGAACFEDFPSYSVQRLSVLLAVDHRRAIVERVFAVDLIDQSLSQRAEQLQESIIITTDQFGDLVFNRKYKWFEGKCEWNRREIRLHLEPDETGSIDNALRIAEQLWAAQREWRQQFEQLVVTQLLELKNEDWLADGEGEYTPTAFKKAIKLQAIHVDVDNNIEFWADGYLFGGHPIHSQGTIENGLTEINVG